MLRPCVTEAGPANFVDLIDLEKINEATYRSTTEAFAPGGALIQAISEEQLKRAFGGHLYAQAVWAAAHTVETGFVVHVCMYSLTAYPSKRLSSRMPGCHVDAALLQFFT